MSQQSLPSETQTPTTNEEYAIQALTIHGAFFERKCQAVVRSSSGWTLCDTNYPVEYQGKTSNLDIWAEKKVAGARLFVPIECKKNNPDFIDWIFLTRTKDIPDLYVKDIEIDRKPNIWVIRPQRYRIKYDLVIADEARETKGNYLSIKQRNDRTKTSNTAISDAAIQISVAAQSLMLKEQLDLEYVSQGGTHASPPYASYFCFPTIVTTANLYSCEFDEADISLATGDIPWNKAKLTKRPYLLFNYPLPAAFQAGGRTSDNYDEVRNNWRTEARMPIFVVQSNALPTFLEQLTCPRPHQGSFGYDDWYALELHPEAVKNDEP